MTWMPFPPESASQAGSGTGQTWVIPDEQIASIRARAFADLPGDVRLVTELAYSIADPGRPRAAVVEAVRQRFGEEATIELVVAVSYFAMLADIVTTFEEVEPGPDRTA